MVTRAGSSSTPQATSKNLLHQGSGIWAAWSGNVNPSSTTEVALEFVTPPQALVTNLTWTPNFDQVAENRNISMEVKINGLVIMYVKGENTSSGDAFRSFPFNLGPFVMPALSEIVITVGSDDAAIDQFITLHASEIK